MIDKEEWLRQERERNEADYEKIYLENEPKKDNGEDYQHLSSNLDYRKDNPKYLVLKTVTKIPADTLYQNIGTLTDEYIMKQLAHKMISDMTLPQLKKLFMFDKELEKHFDGNFYNCELKLYLGLNDNE